MELIFLPAGSCCGISRSHVLGNVVESNDGRDGTGLHDVTISLNQFSLVWLYVRIVRLMGIDLITFRGIRSGLLKLQSGT